jgi:predicted RNA binding protein YcfA (HicA-like mRNA interferase family)
MAENHEREIKRRLKQHGWEFARRGKGGHDIYRHPTLGQLTVTFKKTRRGLKELYRDIEQGVRTGSGEPRPGGATEQSLSKGQPVTSIFEPQTDISLAAKQGITPSAVQARWKNKVVKDGMRTLRTTATAVDRAVHGKGLRYLYYAAKMAEPPVAPAETEDDTMSAAEELLDEASKRLATLQEKYSTEIEDWKKLFATAEEESAALASTLGDYRTRDAEQRERISGLEEQLETAQQQLAIQHQELETDWHGPEMRELDVLRAEVANTRPKILELEAKLEAIDGAGYAPLYVDMAVRDLALAEDHEILAKVSNLRRLLLKQQFEKDT